MIPRLAVTDAHCAACRGKGTRFEIVTHPTFGDRLERNTCQACGGTGLKNLAGCSSAQPHRFASVDFAEPKTHPLAD